MVEGADIIFLLVGGGVRTGSGAAPVVAEIAKIRGVDVRNLDQTIFLTKKNDGCNRQRVEYSF